MQEKNIVANTCWARLFFGMLQRDEDTDKCVEYWEENKEAFQNISDDTYDAIATFTRSEKLLENSQVYTNSEGGIDMCKAFEGLILRGEERGRTEMMQLIQCMSADGALESIPRITTEPEFYKAMLEKYSIGNRVAV